MTNLIPARTVSTLPRKLALPLLLVGALLCLGAKWAEKPIESLASIAGEWRGDGTGGTMYAVCSAGAFHATSYVFKEDGSYDYWWKGGGGFSARGQRPAGTVRLNGGKLEWKDLEGTLWTAALHEGKKGKRMLKGRGEDGGTWQIKPKK
jgi:hypothetical protein